MSTSVSTTSRIRRVLFLFALLIITAGAIWLVVVVSISTAPSATDLQVGDVATQEVLAPHAVNYNSEVLTEYRRQTAADTISPRYTLPDTSAAREQLDHLRTTLAYITSVRSDPYASFDQKMTDLAALQDVQLNQETAAAILELSESRWQSVQQEAIVVLERVMRNTIRDDHVEEARRSVPNLVSLALPEDQADIAAELAAAFIAPNSFYSESLTETARQQAIDAVDSVPVFYAPGETVVRRGQRVTETEIEALQYLGLVQPNTKWQDYVGEGILVLLCVGLIIIYLRRNPAIALDTRRLLIFVGLFLLFLVGARFLLPLHDVLPYIYPIAAYALVVSALYGTELAVVTVIPLTLLSVYGHPVSFELTLYYIVGSLYGIIIPKREQRITAYVWSGLTVAAAGAAVLIAYLLPQPETDWMTLTRLFGLSLVNGLLVSGLSVLLQYLLAPLLGQITPLQLLELSRPDHPLLSHLMHHAPGTYQHSLQVANLAEQAAEMIGANSLLTRVGTLYHDVGKTINPQYFIENQAHGQLNTHDDLDPAESSAVIISHVTYGLDLARKNHLPKRIQDFIAEHHGDTVTFYQWTQALKSVGGDSSQLDKDFFRYPGPRPQSRETALVMLADGCEARIRAKRPETKEALREMVKDTIDKRVASGQLDHTDLTLQDFDTIVNTFTATLRGIYHPRVEYPSLDVPTRPNPLLAFRPAESQEPEALSQSDARITETEQSP
ncbi:HD family phosphohydrolase [Chloroflexota bacterium]